MTSEDDSNKEAKSYIESSRNTHRASIQGFLALAREMPPYQVYWQILSHLRTFI